MLYVYPWAFVHQSPGVDMDYNLPDPALPFYHVSHRNR